MRRNRAVLTCLGLPLACLLWLAGGTVAEAADLAEIPPYVLQLSPNAAELCWVTPKALRSRAVLRSWAGTEQYEDSEATKYHCWLIEGLAAATTYRYEVDEVHQGAFTTPSADQQFRVAAIGHTHGSEAENHYPDELLIATLEDLRPDFVLHAGDLTYFSSEQGFQQHFFRLFEPLLATTPVYVAAANHDSGWPFPDGQIDLSSFRSLFPYDFGGSDGAYYTFTHQQARFFVLSYYTLPHFALSRGDKQYQWLRQQLAKSDSWFNIVLLGGGNFYQQEHEDELFRVLAEYRVELVLGGDSAGTQQRMVNGIPYLFTGTGGAAPHPLRWLEFRDFDLIARSLNARGETRGGLLRVTTGVKPEVVMDLLTVPDVTRSHSRDGGGTTLELAHRGSARDWLGIAGLEVPSSKFDGIRLRLSSRKPASGVGRVRLAWRSATSKNFFRLQSTELKGDGDTVVLLKLPATEPLSGQPYELRDLRLYVDSGSPELSFDVEGFDLIRMPLAARPR